MRPNGGAWFGHAQTSKPTKLKYSEKSDRKNRATARAGNQAVLPPEGPPFLVHICTGSPVPHIYNIRFVVPLQTQASW